MGYKIAHTTSLAYNRTTYDYCQAGGRDILHGDETVHQIILNHSLSLTISKNISGGAHGRLAYDYKRKEDGKPGDDDDDVENILSWEIGLELTIKF